MLFYMAHFIVFPRGGRGRLLDGEHDVKDAPFIS